MGKGRRVKARGPFLPAKGTVASAARAKIISPAFSKAGDMSDESEDFLPLNEAHCDGDNDLSSDEALMMRQMGLEGAEAANEEHEEDEAGAEEESDDAESEGPEGAEESGSIYKRLLVSHDPHAS